MLGPVAGRVRAEQRRALRTVEHGFRHGTRVVGDGERREGERERRRRPGAEGECVVPARGQLIECRVAAVVHELHDVAMRPVEHPGRVVGGDVHVVAEEVGDRDVQLEALLVAEQRVHAVDDGWTVGSHVVERIAEPACDAQAVEQRLPSDDRAQQPRRLHPRRPTLATLEQALDVALVHPHPLQRLLRSVAGDRRGEEHAVDPAGRRPRHDVDDDLRPHLFAAGRVGVPELGLLLELLQQPPVLRCRVGRREVVLGLVALVGDGRRHQPLELHRHAMHVDGERHAAVADEGEAQLTDRRRWWGRRPFGHHRRLRGHVGHGDLLILDANRRRPLDHRSPLASSR